MPPYPCSCGRSFHSAAALAQHRTAKHGSQVTAQLQVQSQNVTTRSTTDNPRPAPRSRRWRDSRLWRGVLDLDVITEIDSANLQPSGTPVSISTTSQLVCSYNWQSAGGFHVPGNTLSSLFVQCHEPQADNSNRGQAMPRYGRISPSQHRCSPTRYSLPRRSPTSPPQHTRSSRFSRPRQS